jgi:hypothetical protein
VSEDLRRALLLVEAGLSVALTAWMLWALVLPESVKIELRAAARELWEWRPFAPDPVAVELWRDVIQLQTMGVPDTWRSEV